jgi:type IV secretion system protein VirD4
LIRAAPPAKTEDPDNAGIRREPALPEHEEIVPQPRDAADEFDLPEDDADDHARRLRVLQRQARGIAQQVSLDPADDMGL